MPRLFLVGEDMIIGIGIDIVEIDRVAKAIKGEAFVKRLNTAAAARLAWLPPLRGDLRLRKPL